MVEIIPSILTNDPNELRDLIFAANNKAKRVQIDIIDGKFANNKTIDPSILSHIDTSLFLDFHLMVHEPINWIERCVRANADRIVGQIEMMKSQKDFVEKVLSFNLQVGLALDLQTELTDLNEDLLNDLDVVLLMSVKAGFGGQEFNEGVVKKLKEIKSIGAHSFKICLDGGVDMQMIPNLEELGVNEVVMGRRWFKQNE
ncbi:hypothetical protein HYS03_00075 [Candidatus Woesebacteria bacterium]|nr:hypothetical protein [Candidatus Woesebacteria bacterium]QQG47592.1 MAG: hypothetical protein HY044_00680 [Candidatus Woesebacteria bacterium]